ncbi:hypothetical protein SDC9_147307 [bioreactor metagenome]|uniref:Uncharacterized protein n=1 Tax=bioreactor metagenome TaxID=1076179 RepID=A0A645EHP0_9ZZZZ
MTAGTDDHILRSVAHLLFILALHQRCADCGLLRLGKADPEQRLAHRGNADPFKIGGKRRRKARNHGRLPIQHRLHNLGAIRNFLRILRANDKTLAAEDAFLAHNMRLIRGKPDGFHRAVANAFIAVFTV